MLQLHADFFVVGLALFVFPLAVASRFVHWTPDLWVRVRALAGDVLLCSWASRGTLAVHTSLHPSVRWVLVNLMLVVILRRTSIPSREVGGGGGEILLDAPHMLRNAEIRTGLMGHYARV